MAGSKKFKTDKNNDIKASENVQKWNEKQSMFTQNDMSTWCNLRWDYKERPQYMNEKKMEMYKKLSEKLGKSMD